jgi:glycosyltransferase involved in cell wall biosynthesis
MTLSHPIDYTPQLHNGTILILTSSYPKTKGEPSGIFLHYLAKELRTAGWDVIVQAPNFPGGTKCEVFDGIKVRRFNYFFPQWQRLCYGSGMLPNLRKSPWLWVQVPFLLGSMFLHAIKLMRTEKIDLINAHWILPQGMVARMVQWLCDIPVVLTVHGGDVFAFEGTVGRMLKRLALRNVSACTANSSFTQQAIQSHNRRSNVRVIPMGVDVDYFHAHSSDQDLRQQLRIEGEMILFVGRLVEKKGVHHLFHAMPSVIRSFPRAVLVIIGDGTQRQELEDLAQRLGIASSLRFLGRISNADLPRYYATADLFVAPSVVDSVGDTEGLGIVFLEAAASEVAMIGSSVGGISDILVDQVTGIQIDPNKPAQLAEGIKRVLSDPQLREGLVRKARLHVVENFSWNHIASRFTALFREVISSRQPNSGT